MRTSSLHEAGKQPVARWQYRILLFSLVFKILTNTLLQKTKSIALIDDGILFKASNPYN